MIPVLVVPLFLGGRSRLDPFKDAIDAILRSDRDTPTRPAHTVQQVYDRLQAEHGMAGVSYSTVWNYITRRRLHLDETTANRGTSRN